jgi:type IV fimbrial biogenesis protein FimT
VGQAARGLAEQVTRARSEAIRQNAFAGLHVFTDGAGGYAVFVDRDGDRRHDPGEEV